MNWEANGESYSLLTSKTRLYPTCQAPTNEFNLSFATTTSLSTNHTLDSYTLVKASHTTNIHSVPIMAQQEPPVPNPANVLAAVNGMTAEGNTITQSAQAYNAYQQALNPELSLCAGYDFARIHQQLAAIQASIVDSMALNTAQ